MVEKCAEKPFISIKFKHVSVRNSIEVFSPHYFNAHQSYWFGSQSLNFNETRNPSISDIYQLQISISWLKWMISMEAEVEKKQ